jgi:DnaJ homolog subfamily C member 17
LLLDPLRRAEIDASVKKRQQHAEQYAKADAKRKHFMDELDASERSFKKAKSMSAVEKRKKEEKDEALREQGRRMREEREGRHTATQKGTNEEQTPSPEDSNMTRKP